MILPRSIPRHPDYFVVMRSFPARYCDGVRIAPAGREAVVDPEVTRREIISRVESGEYKDIVFIHHIRPGVGVEDVTDDILAEASARDVILPPRLSPSERLEAMRDHVRDSFKHERA